MELFKYTLLFLIAFPFLLACEKKPVQSRTGSGKLQFHFSPAMLKSETALEKNPKFHILVSLSDSAGNIQLSGLIADMIRVGSGYYSLPVELPVKNYRVNSAVIFTDSLISVAVIPAEPARRIKNFPASIKIRANQVFTLPSGWFQVPSPTDDSLLFSHPIFKDKNENWVPIHIKPSFYNYQTEKMESVSVNLSVFQKGELIRQANIESSQQTTFIFIPDKSSELSLVVIKDRFQKFSKTVSLKELKSTENSPFELVLTSQYPPTGSLILRFPFTSSTETTGKFKFKAINKGAVFTTDRFGNKNSAVFFNGKAYLDYGDILNTCFLPVTLSAWVRIRGQREQIPGMIFQTDSPPYSGLVYSGISLGFLNNTFSGGTGDGNGGGKQYRRSLSTDAKPYLGKWVHIVYTLKSSVNQKYYLNGKEVTSFAHGTGFELSHNQFPLQIGNGFIGDIDDISFFDYALSSKEADSLYRAELEKPESIPE